MRRLVGLLMPTLSLVALTGAAPSPVGPTATEIVDRYVRSQETNAEMLFFKMTVSAPGKPMKEHRFFALQQKRPDGGRDYMLRLIRPADVEGVTVLVNQPSSGQTAQYVYLPSVGRARRLSETSRREPFLGSSFSYEDLVKELPSTQDYELRPGTSLRDRPCHVIRASDKVASRSAYGWRELAIDKETYDLLRITYYDPQGILVKSLNALSYRPMANKGTARRPTQAVMRMTGREEWTDFTVIEERVGEALPPEIFTPGSIERWTTADIEAIIGGINVEVKAGG